MHSPELSQKTEADESEKAIECIQEDLPGSMAEESERAHMLMSLRPSLPGVEAHDSEKLEWMRGYPLDVNGDEDWGRE